ncbi:Transcriptional activator protein LasR [Paraburkholderia humisilvae]|uniref:Transcriptional activator protein LasR n=1 Tax=Paraburkholderia humisilvae TaxID=627669 RepID=A0A6J5EFH9_9BURK|nr:Transcriptional activator protein LasR [Paraburkholderia humisilvae]
MSNIAGTLNFDFFLYAEIFSFGKQNSIVKIISNYPREWRSKYDSDNYINIDPIMDHCEHRLVPLIWSDIVYRSYRQQEFMEEARGFGLVTGISFPNHWKHGDVGVLSFASRAGADFTSASQHFEPLTIAQGALTAAFMHDVMERLLNKQENVLRAPLTTRELECLKWIAIGKTTWEISSILGISEHGVLYHVRNIMLKFDAQTRHVAVLKAMACGLL